MVNPSVWGPNIWQTLHFISLGYPEYPTIQQKQDYKNFFLLFKTVLPCKKCALHYNHNLDKLPLTDEVLSNKHNLIKWVIDIHNSVNLITDKPIINYYKSIELINKISTCYHNIKDNINDNTKNETSICLYILIIILIIVIIFYLYKNKYLKL